MNALRIRESRPSDLTAIRTIYNQGIEDRIATLDEEQKSEKAIDDWYGDHGDRYGVLVAEHADGIAGWASLNPYSHRCAYRGVADLSIYVERESRGRGIGSVLLAEIEAYARRSEFHKIVLFALSINDAAQRLYHKAGYRDVGVFKEQGWLDGRFVDVTAMEKILRPLVLFVCRHNTGRSQMAEAYLRVMVGDIVDVASAGTIAADHPDPGVVAAMAEDGIDIGAARPKLLDPAIAARADRVITMGCDVDGVARIDEDWGLPDPKDQGPDRVRAIRDLVKSKARILADDLRADQSVDPDTQMPKDR